MFIDVVDCGRAGGSRYWLIGVCRRGFDVIEVADRVKDVPTRSAAHYAATQSQLFRADAKDRTAVWTTGRQCHGLAEDPLSNDCDPSVLLANGAKPQVRVHLCVGLSYRLDLSLQQSA